LVLNFDRQLKMRNQRRASLATLGLVLAIVATSGSIMPSLSQTFVQSDFIDAPIPAPLKFPAILADNDVPTPSTPQVAQPFVATPAADTAADAKAPKLILKPGQPISVGMQTEDIVVTDDIELAKEQVAAFPESPEASFILAVALTRTSYVEQALKEVRRARKLAQAQGGAAYFDKMIATYEDMLKNYPDENRVRYGLAWAYYMKAYVLAKSGKPNPPLPAPTFGTPGQTPAVTPLAGTQVKLPKSTVVGQATASQVQATATTPDQWPAQVAKGIASSALGVKLPENGLPQLERVMQEAPEAVRPEVKGYYQQALKNLDELLARTPDDVWARVYRAFLNAEYTGNVDQAMVVWKQCQAKYPDNPAPYFFLGEGYLKQGNLKECLQNISRAIALRAIGK
jgi:tetratricopeptide (TPR) repeat protein